MRIPCQGKESVAVRVPLRVKRPEGLERAHPLRNLGRAEVRAAHGDSSTGSELKAVEEACRKASRTVAPSNVWNIWNDWNRPNTLRCENYTG
jgi:hypothetical protein